MAGHLVTGCGTAAGYLRHLRARETPCDPCRLAHNAACRDFGKGRNRELRRARPERVAAPAVSVDALLDLAAVEARLAFLDGH